MRPFTLRELAQPLRAQLHGSDCEIRRVSTDSRDITAGDLFVALRGERFDGHDYLPQVHAAGASAAVVVSPSSVALPQLQVTDTQRALGGVGQYNRNLYTGALVAITGSSGKTTVKNMVCAVLSRAGETLATRGNFNNEIGVPLTLLRLHPQVEYAVVEMGAARGGDIRYLCELGKPNIAVLLNAMPAHLEGFGSIEDVAQAKGEIFDDLRSDDCAVINADQPWAKAWRKRAGDASVLDFGLHAPAAITAREIQLRGIEGVSFTASTPSGDIVVRLALPGEHNVANALAAIAVGLACGLNLSAIRDGLESLHAVAGRLRVVRAASGARVIDDCYNANPGSVRAAIDTLAGSTGHRTLVLGAMLELGDDSAALHAEIGAYAKAAGVEQLWGVGPELAPTVEAFGPGGQLFVSMGELLETLCGGTRTGVEFDADDTVLVKGSRGAGMERVLEVLVPENTAVEV